MADRHWIKLTLLLTLLLAAGLAGTNAWIDIYGVFRDPAGRRLAAYGDARVAKYLLSTRYVGANFDGVLIGSSISGNWRIGYMKSVRLYNESLQAGNIVEGKALLDRALGNPTAPPKMVVMVVHPYLTSSHQFETVALRPRELWGALGSQTLFGAYFSLRRAMVGRKDLLKAGVDGTADYGNGSGKLSAALQTLFHPEREFPVDPIAAQAFREAVTTVHARGIPLAFVVPPTHESLLAPHRAAFERYVQSQLAVRGPHDPVLDFNGEEFAAFRSDADHFTDGVHLRDSAAEELTRVLDAHISAWIAQGWTQRRKPDG